MSVLEGEEVAIMLLKRDVGLPLHDRVSICVKGGILYGGV
jgi:hypothetical protein